MTMREKMARALCVFQGFDPDELAPDHMMDKGRVAAGDPPRRWEDYLEGADAVLDAMRSATLGMDDAGRDVTGGFPYAPHDIQKLGYLQVNMIWHAMIDAAKAGA